MIRHVLTCGAIFIVMALFAIGVLISTGVFDDGQPEPDLEEKP